MMLAGRSQMPRGGVACGRWSGTRTWSRGPAVREQYGRNVFSVGSSRQASKRHRVAPPGSLASSAGNGRSLRVVQVRRHPRDRPGLGVLAQADVLRVGSQGDARRREDPVAILERPDLLAYRVDVTGELLPEHTSSGSADAERQPHGHSDPKGRPFAASRHGDGHVAPLVPIVDLGSRHAWRASNRMSIS